MRPIGSGHCGVPGTGPGPYHARRVILVDVDAKRFAIELDQETGGRWIADVPALPGVLAYGATREDTIARVEALALRVLADRLEHGEPAPELDALFVAT